MCQPIPCTKVKCGAHDGCVRVMCVCGGELNFVPTEQPQQLPAARPKCTTTIPPTPTPTPLCKDGPSSSAGLKVPILSFIFSSVQSANGLELFPQEFLVMMRIAIFLLLFNAQNKTLNVNMRIYTACYGGDS